MASGFLNRLVQKMRSGMGPAVVGLDPRLDALPRDVAGGSPAERIAAFYERVLPSLAERVVAVKPNIAFFERHGAAGFAAYETTCRRARELGLLVIGDVKRGDIDTTAEAYAEFHLDVADAVTLQPYMGRDAIEPFVRRATTEGKAVFVLVRTSNDSAVDLQDLRCGDERLCDAVARLVHRLGEGLPHCEGFSPVGAVVGATRPDDIAVLRRAMPAAWFLIPGVGAQGGAIRDCAAAFDARGFGGLINQSRAVMQCFSPGDRDWLARIEAATARFANEAAEVAAAARGRSVP